MLENLEGLFVQLKVEHQGDQFGYNHITITLIQSLYISYLIKENPFPFSIVRMPHIESNIPQNIFYLAIKGEFLRIARSTL